MWNWVTFFFCLPNKNLVKLYALLLKFTTATAAWADILGANYCLLANGSQWFEPLHRVNCMSSEWNCWVRSCPFLYREGSKLHYTQWESSPLTVLSKFNLNPIVNFITLLKFKFCLMPSTPFTSLISNLWKILHLQSESVSWESLYILLKPLEKKLIRII